MKKVASAAFVFALLGTAAAFAAAHDDRVAVMRANNGAVMALRPLVAAYDGAAVKAQGQLLVDHPAAPGAGPVTGRVTHAATAGAVSRRPFSHLRRALRQFSFMNFLSDI